MAAALPAKSKCLACFKELKCAAGHFAVGKTLVLMRREVLDEAERRRGAALFKYALTIQSALRMLAACDLLHRRRKDHLSSKGAVLLQARVRRQIIRCKYVRMVGVARDAAAHVRREGEAF